MNNTQIFKLITIKDKNDRIFLVSLYEFFLYYK